MKTSWIGKTLMAYKQNGEASICRMDNLIRQWQTGNFSHQEMDILLKEYLVHEEEMIFKGLWK